MTVHLIVGPPGAGKSTYAHQHAGPDAQVIDYDSLRAQGMTTEEAHRCQRKQEKAAGAADRDVWIVRTLADPEAREEFIQRIGVQETHILDPGPEACRARVAARDGNTTKYEGITNWYAHNPRKDTMTEQNTPETPAEDQSLDTTQESTESPHDTGHPQEEKEPNRANREAAQYRHQLREAQAERDHLRERVTVLQRAEVEKIATEKNLVTKPATLWKVGLDLNDLLTEDGDLDTEKAVQAIKTTAEDAGLTPSQLPKGLPNNFGVDQPHREAGPAWQAGFAPRY